MKPGADPHLNRLATTELVLVLRGSHCEKRHTGDHLLSSAALGVDQVNRPKADVVVFEKVFDYRDGDRIFATHDVHQYSCKRKEGRGLGGGYLG